MKSDIILLLDSVGDGGGTSFLGSVMLTPVLEEITALKGGALPDTADKGSPLQDDLFPLDDHEDTEDIYPLFI